MFVILRKSYKIERMMIKPKVIKAGDALKLCALKSRFNRLAAGINRTTRLDPNNDQQKDHKKLMLLENQISSWNTQIADN
jgi:hypothetical protein